MQENKIHNGTNPKTLLKKRGGTYDGQGLFPQVPDFLGYLLGFMLIWLFYTGFGAVSGVLTESKQKVVAMKKEVTAEARETVQKIKHEAERIEQQEVVRARLGSDETSENVSVKTKKRSWTSRQLKKANTYIDVLVDKTGAMLAEAISESDHTEPSYEAVEETMAPPVTPDYSLDRF